MIQLSTLSLELGRSLPCNSGGVSECQAEAIFLQVECNWKPAVSHLFEVKQEIRSIVDKHSVIYLDAVVWPLGYSNNPSLKTKPRESVQ
jgi:hypothetical protein